MLRTFVALHRERSVSRAAERLFLSQPAVSGSLKRLREAFGDPLFVRTGHGVVPTPCALALAPKIESLLEQLAGLAEEGKGFDLARSDRIFRVAGSDFASTWVLPELCSALAASGSAVRIFWEAANYASLAERLHKGDVDLGLMARPAPPSEVEAAPLYRDDYVVVCRDGHSSFGRGADLDAFCATPQVFLGYGRSQLDDTIDLLLARAGRRRHMQVAVTSFAQMAALVARTDHCAVFPRRVAVAHAASLAVHELPFELPGYALYVCRALRAHDDPGTRWLRDELIRIASAANARP